jgi:ADP-ribose pyrophosphatase YjhB (NUDIX family)
MIKIGLGIIIMGCDVFARNNLGDDLADKILMIKRGSDIDGSGLWGLPGGHIEQGETWSMAASREASEEVAVTCTEFRQIGWSDYISDSGQQYITLFIKALKWAGTPYNCELHKHDAIEWRKPIDIVMHPELYFEPLSKLIIDTDAAGI